MSLPEAVSRELSCPICAGAVPPDEAIACARCSSPHHEDCWEFQGGCSRFGCGETRWVHYRCIPRELVSGRLELEARPGLPAAYREQLVTGMARRKLGEVTRSLGLGLLGSGAAMATLFLQEGAVPPDLKLLFLMIGAGFGILAPFLAPLQIRFPFSTFLGSTIAVPFFFMLATARQTSGIWGFLMLFAIIGVTSITAGATLSEWLLGRRRTLGILLGAAATPLRYLVTGGGCSAALLLGLFLVKPYFNPHWVLETVPFAIAAMFAAGYPLEKAKDALLARAEEPERLISG